MRVLNFTHPLSSEHLAAIKHLTGQEIEQVRDIPTRFDHDEPFIDQARVLADSIGFSSQDWQTKPLLINLPSLNVIAALLLAELHGRMGYFPAILRLRPVAGSVPPQFEVAEVLNLQAARDTAREKR